MSSSQAHLQDESSPSHRDRVFLNQEQSIDFGLSQTQRSLSPFSERKQRRYRESFDRINVYRSPLLSDDSLEEPIEDAFASLECLIDDEQEGKATNDEPVQETSKQQQQQTVAASHEERASKRQSEASFSASDDFPFRMADEPELEPNDEMAEMGTLAEPPLCDSGNALEREIRRKRPLETKKYKISQPSLLSDSVNANSLLEKSRRVATKQARARDDLPVAHGAKRPKKKGTEPIAVVSKQSIVGSRYVASQ